MKKTLICLITALCLLLGCCPAFAETDPLFEDVVLMDKDGVKIYLTGTFTEYTNALGIDCVIENNTDCEISITYNGTVNGWTTGNYYLAKVKANSKAKEDITLMTDDFGVATSADVATMDLTFEIEDAETYDTITTHSTGMIVFRELPDAQDDEGLVLFDQDGVKVYLTGDFTEYTNAVGVNCVVVNNTNAAITVMYDGTLNGWTIGNYYLTEVMPNSKAKDDMAFMMDDFEISTGDDIETMDLVFEVRDAETYDTMFTVETGVIDMKNATVENAPAAGAAADAGEPEPTEEPEPTPEPEPEMDVYAIGDTAKLGPLTLTFDECGVTDCIYSSITPDADWYTYYESENGDPYFYLFGTVKNEGGVPVDISNIFTQFDFNGTYSFCGDIDGVLKGSSYFIDDLSPFDECSFYVFVPLPDELADFDICFITLGAKEDFGIKVSGTNSLYKFDKCEYVLGVEITGEDMK